MIKAVHVFMNGMCMVFDETGQQMSDYQGPWNEVKAKILAAAVPETTFDLSQWQEWTQAVASTVIKRISIEVPK